MKKLQTTMNPAQEAGKHDVIVLRSVRKNRSPTHRMYLKARL
jgi:hypothetical protein